MKAYLVLYLSIQKSLFECKLVLLVRERGVEPLRFYPPDPKSGASASFATLAFQKSVAGGQWSETSNQPKQRLAVILRCQAASVKDNLISLNNSCF